MAKKIVFLTGPTGDMGTHALKKLTEHLDELHIRVLARDSKKNRKILSPYEGQIEVLWGDLKDDDLLRQGVTGADYVLHAGVFISPACDAFPEEALRVNYGSTLSMLKSIIELGQKDTTRFLYIGSCAMTGDRQAPIHWGRIGDPLKVSQYDHYGLSKIKSEYAVFESGLKYVASCRLGGMYRFKANDGNYPIISHQPLNYVLEYTNPDDAGNLLRNIVMYAPEEFWGHAYNISSGPDYRVTGMEVSGEYFRSVREPHWHPLYNFHGQYYLDADHLNEVVPFRTGVSFAETMKEAFENLNQKTMEFMEEHPELANAPKPADPKAEQYRIFCLPGGSMHAIENNDEVAIKVWWGSREKYESLSRNWDDYSFVKPLNIKPLKPMSIGIDESKPVSELDIEDMKQAAAFRGGKCLSETMVKGDMYTPLKWESADGYVFEARPNTVIFCGHWSPDDMRRSWRYIHIAKQNPFFNQAWEPLHKGETEEYEVPMLADGTAEEAKYGFKF